MDAIFSSKMPQNGTSPLNDKSRYSPRSVYFIGNSLMYLSSEFRCSADDSDARQQELNNDRPEIAIDRRLWHDIKWTTKQKW